MRVALGKFACSAIETHLGGDVPGAVQVALLHYVRRLSSGRRPPGFPQFLDELPPKPAAVEFELLVDPEIEAAFERERMREGATVEQLIAHAVFVYLSDLYRGPPASPDR